jgi:hypothetical protein
MFTTVPVSSTTTSTAAPTVTLPAGATTPPAPQTVTASEMFLCSFPGNATRLVDPSELCPFDNFAFCRSVTNNSCTYFRSGNAHSYNLVTFHTDPLGQHRYSVQLFTDASCRDEVLGIYVGARDMIEDECRGLLIEGVGPIQVCVCVYMCVWVSGRKDLVAFSFLLLLPLR